MYTIAGVCKPKVYCAILATLTNACYITTCKMISIVHVHTYICMYMYMYIRRYIRTCTCTCIYVHVYVYTYLCQGFHFKPGHLSWETLSSQKCRPLQKQCLQYTYIDMYNYVHVLVLGLKYMYGSLNVHVYQYH